MALITKTVVLRLDGDTPPELGLDRLPVESSIQAVADGLSLVSAPEAPITTIDSDTSISDDHSAFVVIYLVGHAWLDLADGKFQTSVRMKETEVLDGKMLINILNRHVSDDSNVLILVDTCHASALAVDLEGLRGKSVTAIFASAADENAWSLRPDGVTRFAFEWSEALRRSARQCQPVRATALADIISDRIERDVLVNHQQVDYLVVRGGRIVINGGSETARRQKRNRTRRIVVSIILLIGIIATAVCFLLRDYWHDNLLVTLDLRDIDTIMRSTRVTVFVAAPDEESGWRSESEFDVTGSHTIRKVVPATNLLIVVDGEYEDGKRRHIRFHIVSKAGWITRKCRHFVVPAADDVKKHHGMAYVSAAQWLSGNPPIVKQGPTPFWIDIAPPTVGEYLPFLVQRINTGELAPIDSTIAFDLIRAAGSTDQELASTTLRLPLLSQNADPNSIAACSDCPAPMGWKEAEYFLAHSHGKVLPTTDQWELAVRGVDGRTFPWGDTLDRARVNAGLPNAVGPEHASRLRNAKDFPTNSPFGLEDTVGNAGDWVRAPDGAAAFMGGTYIQNEEDCTTFAFMRIPITQLELLSSDGLWLVTCRGVSPAND